MHLLFPVLTDFEMRSRMIAPRIQEVLRTYSGKMLKPRRKANSVNVTAVKVGSSAIV